MNFFFENNNDLFFETKGAKEKNIIFSRTEQYYLHRTDNTIGKIYIRADTRKMEVKRTYQMLTEFFAVTFSFWEDLFLICNFILNIYNRFCLNYSIGRKLFFLEGKDDTHFNLTKNSKAIKALINLTNNASEKNIPGKNNVGGPVTFVRVPSVKTQDFSIISERKTFDQNELEIKKLKNEQTLNRFVLIFKRFLDFLNIFECNCCKCKKLERRTILFSNAEDIINTKLDIVYYLKSILLLDIIKKTSMDDKKEMLNFLCMPFVSSNMEDNMIYYDYHKNFSDADFKSLEKEINEFVKKKHSDHEKELIVLINGRLKRYNN